MRTLRTPQPSSSDRNADILNLKAPASWAELTQEQWRYTLTMMTQRHSLEVKVLMLLRFCGIDVKEKQGDKFLCHYKTDKGTRKVHLCDWQVQQMIHTFDFIDSYDGYTVRLEKVGSLHAESLMLHGVQFVAYLNMEKYYQGFLRNRGDSSLLEKMARVMYVTDNPENPYDNEHIFSEAERLHCFLWFSYVKKEFGSFFPHLFKAVSSDGSQESETEVSIIDKMNIQIRALTGGDITKEEKVLSMDCWRALTELDAKAREAAEIKKKMQKK